MIHSVGQLRPMDLSKNFLRELVLHHLLEKLELVMSHRGLLEDRKLSRCLASRNLHAVLMGFGSKQPLCRPLRALDYGLIIDLLTVRDNVA